VSLPGRSNATVKSLGASVDDLMKPLFDSFLSHGIISSDIGYRVPKLIFFAHSVGCYVAFELARFLRRKGYENLVSTLVVSSSKAPHLISEYNSDKWNRFYFLDSAKDLINRLEVLGGLPSPVKERQDLLSVILSTVRNDYQLMEKYKFKTISTEPSKPLKCSIVTIAADDDESMTLEELAEWATQSTGKHCHHVFRKGGHCYLSIPQYEAIVLNGLIQLLDNSNLEKIEFGQVVPDYAIPEKLPEKENNDDDW
jgi:surfactin synthase thioesterase subunit